MPSSSCSRCSRRKSSSPSPVIRRNHATLLGVDADFLRSPRKHGKMFNIAYARNYNGNDEFQVCVVKWPRKHFRCPTGDVFQQVIRISLLAARIIEAFVAEVDTKGWRVELNVPSVWRSQTAEGRQRSVLVEPLIDKFRKFNSNSGWVGDPDRSFSKVAQALSHYSYAWSGGKFVLCDLQGGIMGKHHNVIVLTDPAITSWRTGAYGCTDNGSDYLRNFFKHHECSSMCKRFPKPKDNKVFFRPVMSTTTTSES